MLLSSAHSFSLPPLSLLAIRKLSTMKIFLLLFSLVLLFANATVIRGPPIHAFARSKSLNKNKNDDDKSNQVSMGTTLVALCCKGGVVVGADTRTSVSGYVSNRYAHKLTPLSDSVVVCRSGSAADTQRLCDEAKWELQSLQYSSQRTLQVSQVAQLLRSYMVDVDLQASLLCAGVTPEGKGELYAILPSGALLKHDLFAVSGSGSTYIMGYLDDQLSGEDDELLEEEAAIEMVTKAIQLAMDRDGSSGGFVRIYSITSKGRRSITIYPSHQQQDESKENKATAPSSSSSSSADLPGFAPPRGSEEAS